MTSRVGNGNQEEDHKRRKRRRKICIIVLWVIGILVTLGLVFTILGLTVFKAKRPVTTVNSVSLQDLKFSLDIARLKVYINATLLTDLSVKNPNRVGFKYSSSFAYLKYKDQEVGEAPIPAGKIGSGETIPMNLTMNLMADRILSGPDFFADVSSGALPLSAYVKLTGKVDLLFKIKVKSYSTCNFTVDVFNRALSGLSCNYKTKL